MIKLFFIYLLFIFLSFSEQAIAKKNLIKDAVDNQFRKEINKSRDKYRNPVETLNFFGLRRDKKVLEIIPGRGWYTEIISKYMNGTDNFYVATYENPSYAVEIINKIQKEFVDYFKKEEKKFGKLKYVLIDDQFRVKNYENYFDLILTFRNTHNFLDQKKSENIFKSFHKSLKKNGILGLVQHRADESSNYNFQKGYVKESFLVKHVEKHGFELIDKSEINANLKDLKNYEKGVWTLPPRLSEGEKNKSYYLSIGESDRMTLKFKKK